MAPGVLGSQVTGDGTVPVLRGEVVILDAFRTEDAAAHLAGEDEEMARRFGWWPKGSTLETVLPYFDRCAADWREHGPTRAFAVRDGVTGDLVGSAELRIRADGSGEVSYSTHTGKRRRGYARHALALLCEYAATLGVAPLEAHVAVDNHASRRIAEACGFSETGTITGEGELRIRYLREKPRLPRSRQGIDR